MGSSEETRGWLDFSLGCGYIDQDEHDSVDKKYDEVNAMLYSLINNWKTLQQKQRTDVRRQTTDEKPGSVKVVIHRSEVIEGKDEYLENVESTPYGAEDLSFYLSMSLFSIVFLWTLTMPKKKKKEEKSDKKEKKPKQKRKKRRKN